MNRRRWAITVDLWMEGYTAKHRLGKENKPPSPKGKQFVPVAPAEIYLFLKDGGGGRSKAGM